MNTFAKKLTSGISSLLTRRENDADKIESDEVTGEDSSSAAFSSSRRTHSNLECPRLSRKADPTEVAAMLPILDSLAKHVQDTAEDLQHSVLQISSGFGGMAARVRETIETAHGGLTSDSGSNTDETIHDIRAVLGSLLSAVQESTDSSQQLSERIQKLEQVLAEVNASLRQVETIAEEARIVGLNGRLEAARAGTHGAAFNVVANETKNLGVHAAETSASIRRQVEQLNRSLHQVSTELRQRITIDAESARDSQVKVTNLLDQLGVMHHGLTSSLQRTESLSEAVSRDITKSVMALQFQDRVNQRLDHVVEALQALKENLSPFRDVACAGKASSRSADWRAWLNSRSTMSSERQVIGLDSDTKQSVTATDFGSVELF
jgi:methyl-accepting chemotaxis protein